MPSTSMVENEVRPVPLAFLARRWPRLWELAYRFMRFGLVGFTGIFVNEAAVAFFLVLGLPGLGAVIAATQVSSLWNFVLIERWAFKHKQQDGRSLWYRALMFFGLNNLVTLVLQAPMILALEAVGVSVLWGNLISLLILSVARFVFSDAVIWASGGARRADADADDETDADGASRVLYVAGDVAVEDLAGTMVGDREIVDLTEEVTVHDVDGGLRGRGSRRRFPVLGSLHVR